MTVLTQGIQQGEWLLSEAEGLYSRDQFTVTVAGAVALPSGTVLGKITATGKLIKYSDAAVDGSQVAMAILWNPLPGVNGDYKATAFVRATEAIGSMLNGGVTLDANGLADLKAIGIIVR